MYTTKITSRVMDHTKTVTTAETFYSKEKPSVEIVSAEGAPYASLVKIASPSTEVYLPMNEVSRIEITESEEYAVETLY